jgi:hypothetical protein
MNIIMNMGNYEFEADESVTSEYGVEVMCAGWNPALALAQQQQLPVAHGQQVKMPADLAVADTELFLQKMYSYQR